MGVQKAGKIIILHALIINFSDSRPAAIGF
jgi:hypothetical protein